MTDTYTIPGNTRHEKPRPGDPPLTPRRCPCCGGTNLLVYFTYDQPPPLEFRYEFTQGYVYWRELHRCRQCGHFYEWHEMDQSRFYNGDYVSATYGDLAGIKQAFARIVGLPPEKSDNTGRVQRVLAFADKHLSAERIQGRRLQLLDVGSGLCVFGYSMKAAGWDCTALDMDERLVRHAHEVVGVRSIMADVTTVEGLGTFDLVTLNKVLEHVENPIPMLASLKRLLKPGGCVYIEVPDGEAAEEEGKEREEFLLGHVHVFSAASFALLIQQADFRLIEMERLREPSSKFTLRAFMMPKPTNLSLQ